MLTSLGHGKLAVVTENGNAAAAARAKGDMVVARSARGRGMPQKLKNRADSDRFGYFFPDAAEVADNADAFNQMGRIGSAMITNGIPGPSGLASIITFLGQFIDHDVTANTDRNPADLESFSIDPADQANPSITRNSRADVIAKLGNLRRGSLRLDSVYGDGTDLDDALRDGEKMRIGQTTAGRPFDLPRFGQVPGLEPDLEPGAAGGFGPVNPDKVALIGDGRNDENMIIGALHLAFLRAHNAFVDSGLNFDDARRMTEWHYQWLIVNSYLPALCHPGALGKVMRDKANGYKKFARDNGGFNEDRAPIPLEFSVAAYRHGHSLIRNGYRLNATANGNGGVSTASDIFENTGTGGMGGAATLRDDWVIDWDNFLDDADPQLATEPLDTALAAGLGNLVNEPGPFLKNLAQRNLRRGYVLNLPSAQAAIASMPPGQRPNELSANDLRGVPGGNQVDAEGLIGDTPMWFYILAESEVQSGGRQLGELGTMLTAETLVGLVVQDHGSYWNENGSDQGKWQPSDETFGIDSFGAFLSFAGVR